MIKLDINKIINGIKIYMRDRYYWSSSEEPYKSIIVESDWKPDGTGQAVTTKLDGIDYFILLDEPVLSYFNKIHEYTMCQTCHLRQRSKYNADALKFQVVFTDLPIKEESMDDKYNP